MKLVLCIVEHVYACSFKTDAINCSGTSVWCIHVSFTVWVCCCYNIFLALRSVKSNSDPSAVSSLPRSSWLHVFIVFLPIGVFLYQLKAWNWLFDDSKVKWTTLEDFSLFFSQTSGSAFLNLPCSHSFLVFPSKTFLELSIPILDDGLWTGFWF